MNAQTRSNLNAVVCGLGRAGKIHCNNILANKRTHVKYIVDIDTKSAQDYARENQMNNTTIHHLSEFENLLNDKELHFVVVSNPTNAHEEIIVQALKAKKHVFCEKPIADSPEKIQKCYELAKTMDRILFCSFNRRFDPSIMAVKQSVEDNVIGIPHLIRTTSRDGQAPTVEYVKHCGGLFHDCAIHDIDMITWILGEFPSSVYSMSYCNDPDYRAIGAMDTAVINFKFPSGKLGVISVSRHSTYGYDQRLEVHGDKGMAESLNQRGTNFQLSNSEGTHLTRIIDSFAERYAKSYNNSLSDFLDTIEGAKCLGITSIDVANVTRVADACEQSAVTNQVVYLNWDQ